MSTGSFLYALYIQNRGESGVIRNHCIQNEIKISPTAADAIEAQKERRKGNQMEKCNSSF